MERYPKAKFLLMLTMLLISFAISAAEKVTEIFTLDHQMSKMCEKKITSNLPFEKGVTDLNVSLSDNTITITYDPAKSDTEKIIKAFKKIGFNAELLNPVNKCSKSSSCCEGTAATGCEEEDCHK